MESPFRYHSFMKFQFGIGRVIRLEMAALQALPNGLEYFCPTDEKRKRQYHLQQTNKINEIPEFPGIFEYGTGYSQ